ncbi:MAG: radical SAM protein [Ruminococcaceae bacterium]|nr:radical SAM protein [Oscillospiraceae bacterium]
MEHAVMDKVAHLIIGRALKYIEKDPAKNMMKIIRIAKRLMGKTFPASAYEGMVQMATDENNNWHKYAVKMIEEVDHEQIENMLVAFGLHGAIYGTKTVRANREKYGCNIPFILLLDPTSACNLRCKGCWSAEYDHALNLSLEEMQSIVAQAKALGTRIFMFTGGEPLVRKKDILRLAKENPECVFLAYTNGTLIDKAFVREMKQCGNFLLALSVEGDESSNDARRGKGIYQKSRAAMKLLKENKCLFGVSVCYTSQNIDAVTDDAFFDDMIDAGARFGLYFHYMPVGTGAVASLMPNPEQRVKIYNKLRRVRSTGEGAKPFFVMDFQNDGEFVGGCIAGGRNYFHINAAGDMEPCVFVHYSDSNIRKKTILEALQSPLFMAYYKGQPFNDNHLMPCPMLENPHILRKMVTEVGAVSTDMIGKESVDELCGKCDDYAAKWMSTANELWKSKDRYAPFTQYYRDHEVSAS